MHGELELGAAVELSHTHIMRVPYSVSRDRDRPPSGPPAFVQNESGYSKYKYKYNIYL